MSASPTRQQKIDEYIWREAFGVFLVNLTNSVVGEPLVEVPAALSVDAFTEEMSDGLSRELWPEIDDEWPEDFNHASVRVDVLIAHIFAQLAATPQVLARHAAYFTELAAGKLGLVEAVA